MKYVSLDLETTGLDPQNDQIIQLSMVVEDTAHPEIPVEELPHFTCYVKQHRYEGNAYALAMNSWILDILSGRKKCEKGYPILNGFDLELESMHLDTNQVQVYPLDFLKEHFGDERITVAGKNVAGFDMQFFTHNLKRRFRHKVMDPAMLFFDPINDDQVPGLEECLRRAGLPDTVPHDAREDAMLVIKLIRAYYKGVK